MSKTLWFFASRRGIISAGAFIGIPAHRNAGFQVFVEEKEGEFLLKLSKS